MSWAAHAVWATSFILVGGVALAFSLAE
jgi:hypothetical protein